MLFVYACLQDVATEEKKSLNERIGANESNSDTKESGKGTSSASSDSASVGNTYVVLHADGVFLHHQAANQKLYQRQKVGVNRDVLFVVSDACDIYVFRRNICVW